MAHHFGIILVQLWGHYDALPLQLKMRMSIRIFKSSHTQYYSNSKLCIRVSVCFNYIYLTGLNRVTVVA